MTTKYLIFKMFNYNYIYIQNRLIKHKISKLIIKHFT